MAAECTTHNDSTETFSIKPALNFGVGSAWMIGFASSEVQNSFFTILPEIIKLELFADFWKIFNLLIREMKLQIFSIFQPKETKIHYKQWGQVLVEHQKTSVGKYTD